MRYPASEKLEVIHLVEQSHQPIKRTLEQIGVSRPTFYRWYDAWQQGGVDALEDRRCGPKVTWNRIPDDVRDAVVKMALDRTDLSPRELAVTFTDEKRYFISEASVYRILKARDLIPSPAFIVIKAADEFKDKTTRPNEMWQTDFTYLKVIGWGWYYLSTVLDDFSRYIVSWKLCTNMASIDAQETLDLALQASGSTRSKSDTDLASSRTMGHLTCLSNLPTGLPKKASPTRVERLTIHRPRARSSAGTRRSKTASFWKTISCPVT